MVLFFVGEGGDLQDQINNILQYWFGEISNQLSPINKMQLWYQSSKNDDEEIRKHFLPLYELAVDGKLGSWLDSAQGTLALIILLDQMPRNMFRGTAQAFSTDKLALSYCLKGIEQGFDAQLSVVEKSFFYHPLEHSENLADQDNCVELFSSLLREYQQGDIHDFINKGLNFAIQHRDIIAKFSRFPHRNKVLSRESSPQEVEFLKQGVNFGQ